MKCHSAQHLASAFVQSVTLACLVLAGCSDPEQASPDGGTNTKCAKGLKAMGGACVPLFDECAGDEVPVPGGGCKRVGVKECLGGWGLAGPPDWKCKPIGPPRKCLKGWEKVRGGWCEPILPKTKCPAGTMEKIGYATCQPIGDCGTGTWGKIKTTAQTIYVDHSFAGGTSDGSKAKPYTTITAALAVAKTGGHVAVAAGTYKETVSISRKVTVEGVCAQKVTIQGVGKYQAVDMAKGASGTVLRGVTITGTGIVGLWVNGVDVTVERAVVRGYEGPGIDVEFGGKLTLRHSLVAGNRAAGLRLYSSKATLEWTVVRDTRERASDNGFGMGIHAQVQSGKTEGSELTVRDSLFAGNRTAGIDLLSSKAIIERTVVRDTREQVSNQLGGMGIQVRVKSGLTRPSELTARDSLVAGNRAGGIAVLSSKATVERTVVRDTREQVSDKTGGTGLQAAVQPGQSEASELTVRQSLVAGNRSIGINLLSSKATVERTVVRDTREQLSNNEIGAGIQAMVQSAQGKRAELTISDSLVVGNRDVGIALLSSKAALERTVVRDTRERASDSGGGTGIYAQVQSGQSGPSELTVRDSVVARNRLVGFVLLSSRATLERTVVRDTREESSTKVGGSGIHAVVQPGQSRPSELTVRDSLVAANRDTGITLVSSKGTVERTVVRETRPDGNNRYGDGLVVGDKAMLKIRDTTVERNTRAGFIFLDAGGSVDRCLIRDNVFAIDLEQGAAPVLGEANLLIDNKVNKVSSGQGLKPAPTPSVPNPLGSDAGTKTAKDAGPPP